MAVRYIVRGVVQGVGFRWFVWRLAERLGVRGWARNLPDGTVEVVAEAPTDELGRFEETLAHGPAGARIDNVERTQLSHHVDLPKSFEIR